MSETGLSFRDWVASAIRLLLSQLGRFGKFLVGLLFALFVASMLVSAVLNAYQWLQVLFLIFFFIADLYLISVLFDQGRRTKAFLWLIRDDVLGWHYPIVVVVLIFFLLAIAVFSTAAVLFQEWGWVNLHDPSCEPPCRLSAGEVGNFYTWHLLEAVPLLQINDTLRWDVPLVYRGALAGWLLLGFKIAVILPLIQSVRIYWKVRSVTPRLRLRAWPRIAALGIPVTVSWASAPPPDGYVFDVQVKEPPLEDGVSRSSQAGRKDPPEASRDPQAEDRRAAIRTRLGEGWMPWLRGQTTTSSEYLTQRPGVYRFQAWWRERAGGQLSNTPGAVSVRVRPARQGGNAL